MMLPVESHGEPIVESDLIQAQIEFLETLNEMAATPRFMAIVPTTKFGNNFVLSEHWFESKATRSKPLIERIKRMGDVHGNAAVVISISFV